MSDDFDAFDFGETEEEASRLLFEEEDEESENRDQRRNLSMAMTQKLYGKQGASTTLDIDNYDYVRPRNQFEETVEKENVRVAIDDDTMEKFVVFGGQMNHEDFRRNMEKRMAKDRDLRVFDEFVMACDSDPHFLQLYLSPSKSKLGLQDTILRAFLMIKQSQTKAFEYLLQKLNILAKRTNQPDLLLAQTCVAHMRHLNRLFEPLAVFNTMFEFPFRTWSPEVRDGLIEALPEIFTDISLQQATALRLNQEILETQDIENLPSFQMVIIETLRLLRMEPAVGRQIRMNLINISMEVDVSCLPSLIAFCLSSLVSGQGVKNDDEEMHFHEMLREMSKVLKIDVIKKKTSKADSIICEIFSHFLRFLQLDKKGWKYITSWVNRSKTDKAISYDDEENDGETVVKTEKSRDEEEESNGSVSWMNTFETMLILSLCSSSDCCPQSFLSAVNSRMLNIPVVASTKFLKLVDLAISFKKFASAHLNALINVGKQFIWSQDANIRSVGVNVWKHLFTGMERKDRTKVFNELMKHFSQSELECESVLEVFFKVIKSHVTVILEFSTQVQKCIEHIHNLSISNIKRLFRVLLLMSAAGGKEKGAKCEIDEIISRFLLSISEREKFLGILAILMKIQVEISKKHTENQEKAVRSGIERIEEAVKSSANLRGAFYHHMRIVIENHKRLEEIRYIVEWTDVLMNRFKNDFFNENSEEAMEEGESKWILEPKGDRLVEVVPMFNLIKELLVLKMRWREEDDDSIRSSYDICVIKDLNFALESLVSLDPEDPSSKTSVINHLYFLVQWSRTVLNAFLAQSSLDFLSSEEVTALATKMFYLMMDSEKKLQSTLSGVALWKVPNLKFEKKEDVIVGKVEKKSGKRKPTKRKSDETMMETAAAAPGDTTMNEDGDIEIVKENSPALSIQLRAQFVQLKLRPIVHLMKLAKNKRSCLVYLCDEMQSVLDSLVKMRKKTIPMLAARTSVVPQVDKLYHGDSVTIWFCIKKAVDQIWGIIDSVFEFFSALPEASQEVNQKLQKDMEDLGHKSLALLHTILNGEIYDGEDKKEKKERPLILVRILEKRMNGAENLSNDAEQARVQVAGYLVKIAEFAPTPAVAVAILDVFEDMKVDPDEDGDLRKTMAKYALAYLKKDWGTVDDTWSKGAKFTTAVRDILSHYIRLRRERDQLLAIQWILTNKVVQLVPEDDKRKSCVFSQHSDDDLLEKEDKKTAFHCITKATFGVIFKTLFSSLNSCANRKDLSAAAVRGGGNEEESLTAWETASSCFLILCLLLRVNKIRTTAVLTTAVREGKQFLITVSRKSSFIHLMDNITKGGSNFEVISKKIEKILSAVQQGNRVLQSIGTYAKTSKCVLLLKKFPELRAESENCLRVIHSAMVKNECLNAFTVGLVKSRSIDGEIITEQRESSEESDEE